MSWGHQVAGQVVVALGGVGAALYCVYRMGHSDGYFSARHDDRETKFRTEYEVHMLEIRIHNDALRIDRLRRALVLAGVSPELVKELTHEIPHP